MKKESESLKGYLSIPSKILRIKKTSSKLNNIMLEFKHLIFLVLYYDVINKKREKHERKRKLLEKKEEHEEGVDRIYKKRKE